MVNSLDKIFTLRDSLVTLIAVMYKLCYCRFIGKPLMVLQVTPEQSPSGYFVAL